MPGILILGNIFSFPNQIENNEINLKHYTCNLLSMNFFLIWKKNVIFVKMNKIFTIMKVIVTVVYIFNVKVNHSILNLLT